MSSKRKSHPMKLADEMSIPSITAMPMYPGSSVFPPLLLPPLYRPEFRYGPLVQDGLTGSASDSIVEDNETVRDNVDEIEDADEDMIEVGKEEEEEEKEEKHVTSSEVLNNFMKKISVKKEGLLKNEEKR